MTFTVKDKTDLVVPPSVRRRAGIKIGDRLEFRVTRGVITIVPRPPGTGDEYTREQRRMIDREIAKGLEDFKSGRSHGPFDTAGEVVASIKANLKQRAIASRAKSRVR